MSSYFFARSHLLKAAASTAAACVIALLFLSAPPARAEAGFPVELTHRFGVTRIEARPERVVSLSYIGHDFILALGVKPIALRYWYGPFPRGVWPWADDALGDAAPVVLYGAIDVEQIAALKPDLITGLWSGMTETEYRQLSAIAPTVAAEARYGAYGTPWTEMTRQLGRALGRSGEAEARIHAIEARIERIAAAHPEWRGRSVALVAAGQIGVWNDTDIRVRLLEALGFRTPEAVTDLMSDSDFYTRLSPEDLSPIDTDVILWFNAGEEGAIAKRIPLHRTLRAAQSGGEIFLDDLLAAALSHSSPLSLDYALDQLVPLLEAAAPAEEAGR